LRRIARRLLRVAVCDRPMSVSSVDLSTRQRDAFRRDGYLVLRGHASAECVSALRTEALSQLAAGAGPAEYEADLHYPGAPTSRAAPGGNTARRLLQAYDRGAVFRDWAGAAAVVDPLRQLLGPAVMLSRVHHNCVMTKQPRYSSVTGWHHDIRYWSFERPELISVWLALGREYPNNGCLSFLPGTHMLEIGPPRLDSELFLREDLLENQALIATRATPELHPGDVVFFHCRTFHAAGSNHTDAVKLSLVYTYHAADNHPLAGTRSASAPSVAV
jgi:phytanoyl-CoA hydroxylase